MRETSIFAALPVVTFADLGNENAPYVYSVSDKPCSIEL